MLILLEPLVFRVSWHSSTKHAALSWHSWQRARSTQMRLILISPMHNQCWKHSCPSCQSRQIMNTSHYLSSSTVFQTLPVLTLPNPWLLQLRGRRCEGGHCSSEGGHNMYGIYHVYSLYIHVIYHVYTLCIHADIASTPSRQLSSSHTCIAGLCAPVVTHSIWNTIDFGDEMSRYVHIHGICCI